MKIKAIVLVALAGTAVNVWGGEKEAFSPMIMSDAIHFGVNEGNARSDMTIRGMNGGVIESRSFKGGDDVVLDVKTMGSSGLADGRYKYEIVSAPDKLMTRDRNADLSPTAIQMKATMSKASPVSGSFMVRNGRIVQSTETE